MNKKGFTLIELLIVVAIMAIIAAVVFVSLDPLKRFQDSRDSVRWQQASQILTAIKLDQLDNGGSYMGAVDDMNTTTIYMITSNGAVSGCDDKNGFCDVSVSNDSACVDLTGLVTDGYLSKVPVSPNGDGTWTEAYTGYTLQKSSNGSIVIRSCESENSTEIELSR